MPHAGQPVVARLARVLADPGLQVHYKVPGVGWVDEQGHPSPPRSGRPRSHPCQRSGRRRGCPSPRTRCCSRCRGSPKRPLQQQRWSWTRPAWTQTCRGRAEEVHASRRRLLGTADAERRSLEGRLSAEVLPKLRSVEAVLAPRGGPEEVFSELRGAMAEVAALGRGLYPPALARLDFGSALKELAKRSPVPATLNLEGDIDAASEADARRGLVPVRGSFGQYCAARSRIACRDFSSGG